MIKYTDSLSIFRQEATLPDVYLLDTYRGDIAHSNILQFLKSHDLTRDIPVIVMSSSDKYKDDALAGGAFAFIDKPFHVQQVRDVISRALSSKLPDNHLSS